MSHIAPSETDWRQRLRDGVELLPTLAALLPHPSPLVVDAGAYKGAFLDAVLAVRPAALVHAFEPIPRRARKLEKVHAASPGVHVHPVALGSQDRSATLHVAAANTLSSLLAASPEGKALHGQRIATVDAPRVTVRRLDTVLQDFAPPLGGPVDLFKLDVQGYELHVLAGSGDLLCSTRIVLAEVGFERVYARQPLFPALDRFLRDNGFVLHGLFSLRVHTPAEGPARHLAGDAMYLNGRHTDSCHG